MARARNEGDLLLPDDLGRLLRPRGECELILNEQHFQAVVLEGMLKARVSLDIATADFKAMLVPDAGRGRGGRGATSIVMCMNDLAQRGVEVRLLHSGVPSGPVLEQLRRARGRRPREGGGGGLHRGLRIRRCPRLHMKAVIVDSGAMYLGSANLTGAGLGAKGPTRRNFEAGVWTTAGALIDAVAAQFNALWEGRLCDGCGRRDVCPEPLEEPRL
jgi:phosphatidylserine/phosphatidylglycerophosphate/cardiolipin synthase-like enzyme